MRLDLIFQAKFVICNLIQSSSFFAIRVSSSFINATLAFFYRTIIIHHGVTTTTALIFGAKYDESYRFQQARHSKIHRMRSFQCIQCPKLNNRLTTAINIV